MEKTFDGAAVGSQDGSNSDLEHVEIDWTIEEEAKLVRKGLVATFQAFQKGLGAFLSTRILLGLCEAGFIPAGLYTITRWYKRDDTSKRFPIYFLGNGVASGCSGLIAYGILHMRGIGGLGGWQWLLIIEGIFTILVGIPFILFFTDSPFNSVSTFRYSVFTKKERHILTKRIIADDPTKIHVKPTVTKEEFRNVVNLFLTSFSPSPLLRLLPQWALTRQVSSVHYGYERLKSNALVSIGSWAFVVTNLLWGYLGDKFQMRGPLVALGVFLFWVFTIADRVMVFSPDGRTRFALLTLTHACGWPWHPLNGSWMALNAGSAGERSITMAILIMSANTSGIIGSQLF
ncbi:related to nicotinamide mononucleotide permease [Fusarium torulosum]|uniref:Related to nicotinamide mononucleotide permease n=1 Tax=Fusarium torulosum TaxID=33205 RepID=A0AAE8SM99_9HYPO|nr:related to nicotinamide mononucleotide permease [Fusarium torulosum]